MSKAFTLIELLVVVAIIALLVSILLPSLAQARDQAKRAQCASNMHQVGIGLSAYSVDFKQTLPMRGGYAYNIKETDEYHWLGGSKTHRSAVNHGSLYSKYCGGDGIFYFCPANTDYFHADPVYGWPSFKFDTAPPGPGVTWGGFMYMIHVVPGCHAKDNGFASFKIGAELFPKGLDPNRSPAAPTDPNGYGGLYDSRHAQYPDNSTFQNTAGYIQVALRQPLSYSRPYAGPSIALLSDMFVGTKAHNGKGFNTLFADYHAKWVTGRIMLRMQNESKPISDWSASSGCKVMPNPRFGMWNVVSSKS